MAILSPFLLVFSCTSSDKGALEKEVQILNLTYITWSCDCANWATLQDIKEYSQQQDKLAERSVFLEPASPDLELSDSLIQFSNQIYG